MQQQDINSDVRLRIIHDNIELPNIPNNPPATNPESEVSKHAVQTLNYKIALKQYNNSKINNHNQGRNILADRSFKPQECPVCLRKLQNLKLFGECLHQFCTQCITQHIQLSLKNFKPIRCLEDQCTQRLQINSPHISTLPIPLRQKYYQILAFTNLSNDPSRKLCPTEGCQGFLDFSVDPLECAICLVKFCKKCLMPSHLGGCDENGVNFLERNFHFKKCNKCKMVVQKDQGCNHMTCKCGYQFCYVCGGQWVQGHQCFNAIPISRNNTILNFNNPNPQRAEHNQIANNQNQPRRRANTCQTIWIICYTVLLIVMFALGQLPITFTLAIPLPFIFIMALIVSPPLAIIKMIEQFSCKQIVIGSVFLFLFCAASQTGRITKMLYHKIYGNSSCEFFFPLSFVFIQHCLIQIS